MGAEFSPITAEATRGPVWRRTRDQSSGRDRPLLSRCGKTGDGGWYQATV